MTLVDLVVVVDGAEAVAAQLLAATAAASFLGPAAASERGEFRWRRRQRPQLER